MSHAHIKTLICNGNIRRSRVVFLSSGFTASEMSSNLSFPAFGISQEFCRQAPGTPFDTSLYAGANGDEIQVYTEGSIALAECGGTVTAGLALTTDSTARIVNANPSSPPWSFFCVGVAEETGAAGQVVRIKVGTR